MSHQTYAELVANETTAGTAVANTASETILAPDIVIPANYFHDGSLMRKFLLTARGKYSNTGTPTMTFFIRINGVGGTVLCKTAAITLPSGLTAAMWEFWADIQVVTIGTAGAIRANGTCIVHSGVAPTVGSTTGSSATTPMTAGGVITPADVTGLDLSAATSLTTSMQWSAASSSNTAQLLHRSLYSWN